MIQLAGIQLPNMIWQNEHDWLPVSQSQSRSLTGKLFVEAASLELGRPIHLTDAWVSRSTLEALRTLASAPAQTHTLLLRGQSRGVLFDIEQGGIRAQPLRQEWDPDANSLYELELFLIEVSQ